MSRLFVITLIILAALALKAQPAGYVAGYNFNNGTASDATGRYNAKAIGVSFVEDRFGNHGFACFLHGNPGSYLNLGTSPLLKPAKGSVSLWFNIDIPMLSGRGCHVNPVILTKSHSGSDFFEAYCIAYDFDDEKLVCGTTNSEFEQRTLHSSQKLSIHVWHHVVLTYDDDFTCLYLDGKLEIKMAKNFRSKFLQTDSVMIGNNANLKNNRFLCGTVDDIAIYNRVLGETEVAALFNAPDPNRNNMYLAWGIRIALALAAIGLITWLIVRRQRKAFEKEKEASKINLKLLELETKAIRSQMNPHFVFNSLNTLMRYILEEDFKNSHLYLTKLSVLMRKLLESSSSELISLSDEINILRLYIELEKTRFNNVFEFEITSSVPLPDETHIPLMLIQPFVENAIWHGLLHKTGDCFLKISFSDVDAQRLKCIIEDNGVGRHGSKEPNLFAGKKSMGIGLIRQRMALLESSTGIRCGLTITDKTDSHTGAATGTHIEIIIPKLPI